MHYFGYGSNMLTTRIQSRVPSARPLMQARVDDYVLSFHKQSRDGSGKCTILPAEGETVYGVVFDVSESDLNALDEAEQQGRRYRRQRITAHGKTTTVEAFAYVAEPFYVNDSLLPYEWYHALVLAGATEHDLPSSYIAQIESVATCPDPNEDRRQKYKALLESAGYSLPSA